MGGRARRAAWLASRRARAALDGRGRWRGGGADGGLPLAPPPRPPFRARAGLRDGGRWLVYRALAGLTARAGPRRARFAVARR